MYKHNDVILIEEKPDLFAGEAGDFDLTSYTDSEDYPILVHVVGIEDEYLTVQFKNNKYAIDKDEVGSIGSKMNMLIGCRVDARRLSVSENLKLQRTLLEVGAQWSGGDKNEKKAYPFYYIRNSKKKVLGAGWHHNWYVKQHQLPQVGTDTLGWMCAHQYNSAKYAKASPKIVAADKFSPHTFIYIKDRPTLHCDNMVVPNSNPVIYPHYPCFGFVTNSIQGGYEVLLNTESTYGFDKSQLEEIAEVVHTLPSSFKFDCSGLKNSRHIQEALFDIGVTRIDGTRTISDKDYFVVDSGYLLEINKFTTYFEQKQLKLSINLLRHMLGKLTGKRWRFDRVKKECYPLSSELDDSFDVLHNHFDRLTIDHTTLVKTPNFTKRKQLGVPTRVIKPTIFYTKKSRRQ